MTKPFATFLTCSALTLAGLMMTGCTRPKPTHLILTTYDEAGTPYDHYADLNQAYYHRGSDGRVQIALITQKSHSIDPTQTVTQLVHIKELWKPNPGITFAEKSQINARVLYAILQPTCGVRYEGSAFVTYKISDRTDQLTGKVESGQMAARYRMGKAVQPFPYARITGRLLARPDSGMVVETLQRIENLFTERVEFDE